MAKVLGIGNALVDIMVKLENDDIIQKFDLLKGGMRLVDQKFFDSLLMATSHFETENAAGGSAANTINGLAKLGVETAFIGKIANDKFGKILEQDMIESGIYPVLLQGNAPTGLAVALVSKDSERTFAVNLGCAIDLSPEDLNNEMFRGYDFFHIEGYLVQNHDLLRKAMKLAKANKIKISIDLASYDVVRENKQFLEEIVKNYVDIVFVNEEEAKAFTGLEPEDALDEISKFCEIAVVKIGKEGSYIRDKNKKHKIVVIEAHSIDTTGAGDLYAAGFIYGLSQNLPLEKCGQLGSVLAGNVIEVIGAKMKEERWSKIRNSVKHIIES